MRSKTILNGNYVIYEDGRVFSNYVQRFLKVGVNTKGYPHIQVVRDKKSTTLLLHTLLYRSFVGDIPEGFEVDHKDGIRGNLQLGNLQLLSLRENRLKSYRQNRCVKGVTNANSKLTEEDVRAIRDLRLFTSGKLLAKRYGVTETAISDICKRKSWTHIP